MRALKFTIISAACAWLLWSLFATLCLTHSSGKNGYGGFPTADRQQLYDFLASKGFTRVPTIGPLDTAISSETFQGSSDGSRPIRVTISTRPGEEYGIYVETSYDYHGVTWSVDESTGRARQFTDSLDHWLTERRMKHLSAATP